MGRIIIAGLLLLKMILVGLVIAVLSGCTTVSTDTEQVLTPILYCPAPTTIERPVLPINKMTKAQKNNLGELAKHYKATIQVLIGYSSSLELSLDQYTKINAQYDELRNELESKLDESDDIQQEYYNNRELIAPPVDYQDYP